LTIWPRSEEKATADNKIAVVFYTL